MVYWVILCLDSLSFTFSSPLFCSEVYSSAAEGRKPSIRESKLIGFDNLTFHGCNACNGCNDSHTFHGCNACNDCNGPLYSMVVMFVMVVMTTLYSMVVIFIMIVM